MRINVYSQELTKEIELVSSMAADTGITYYGVRLYLHSPKQLHQTEEDDDRSAITLWIPNAESMSQQDLADVLYSMGALVENAPTPEPND